MCPSRNLESWEDDLEIREASYGNREDLYKSVSRKKVPRIFLDAIIKLSLKELVKYKSRKNGTQKELLATHIIRMRQRSRS